MQHKETSLDFLWGLSLSESIAFLFLILLVLSDSLPFSLENNTKAIDALKKYLEKEADSLQDPTDARIMSKEFPIIKDEEAR